MYALIHDTVDWRIYRNLCGGFTERSSLELTRIMWSLRVFSYDFQSPKKRTEALSYSCVCNSDMSIG